jgi:ABC transport system ATP-binding/permease protein
MSYAEKKEFEQMEVKIEQIESEIKRLNEDLNGAGTDSSRLQEICTELNIAEIKLEQLFLRWEELAAKERL